MTLPPNRIARPLTPIRVAVDLSNLRPGGENGGVKPFIFETLRWLGRQQRKELQMIYLTCSETHAEVRDELARVHDEVVCVRDNGAGALPAGNERAPSEWSEWSAAPPPPDLLWRLGARVLYCPFGQAQFAFPGIPTICTIVDVLHRDFPWSLTPHDNSVRERMFQEILAVADRLQCISRHVVSRMQEHYGTPAERMFTVYIAVHQRFAAMAPPQMAPGKVDRPHPFFFYPANAWRHKNHETLLLAYGIYRARATAAGNRPWGLVLTGHEDARWNEMRELAGTLGLLNNGTVHFQGYVAPEQFARLWESAGALVFPSLHEGFGIPLIEAMQHDLPIVSSREGSLWEVGADACLYADARRPESLAEAMERMATDPALRQRLVEAGRQRLQDFSLGQESSHLLDAILELASKEGPYRPMARGIFPDGWTEATAVFALPVLPDAARLSLRVAPMPAPRQLRLRAGVAALGAFDLRADGPPHEITVDFRPAGGALWLEMPNAANLNASDARQHGVQLLSATLQTCVGEFPLFSVSR